MMRKLVLAAALMLLVPASAFALQLEIYSWPVMDHNGKQVGDAGALLIANVSMTQFIWVGANGVVDDPLTAYGPVWNPGWAAWIAGGCMPIGDDQLVTSSMPFGNPSIQAVTEWSEAWTGQQQPSGSPYLDPANNAGMSSQPYVYVRVFEAGATGPFPMTYYGNSQTGQVDTGSPVPWRVDVPSVTTDHLIPEIPEPSVLLLMGAGILALFVRRKK